MPPLPPPVGRKFVAGTCAHVSGRATRLPVMMREDSEKPEGRENHGRWFGDILEDDSPDRGDTGTQSLEPDLDSPDVLERIDTGGGREMGEFEPIDRA